MPGRGAGRSSLIGRRPASRFARCHGHRRLPTAQRRPRADRRGRSRLPRPPADAQPAPLGAARGAGHQHERELPLRRLRPRGLRRGARDDDGPAARLGDRAVPVLCEDGLDPRHRRDRRRGRPARDAGARGRTRERPRDPDGQRGARPARLPGRGAVADDARRAAAGRLPAATVAGLRRVDRVAVRPPGRARQPARRARRHAERGRALGALGPRRGGPRHLVGRARDRRRLDAVGHRAGARPSGRAATASTTRSASCVRRRRHGSCATSRSTASTPASPTDRSICGAKTAS